MEKVILIKYGELSTKKDNINYFLTRLRDNILFVLKDLNVKVDYDKGRMFIHTKEDFETVISRVTKVFGIHEINICYIIESIDFKEIADQTVNLLKEFSLKTFKVESKRSNKRIPLTSIELSKNMGAQILKNIPNLKVDVNNPEVLVNIEYRNSNTLVYFEQIKGLGEIGRAHV